MTGFAEPGGERWRRLESVVARTSESSLLALVKPQLNQARVKPEAFSLGVGIDQNFDRVVTATPRLLAIPGVLLAFQQILSRFDQRNLIVEFFGQGCRSPRLHLIYKCLDRINCARGPGV